MEKERKKGIECNVISFSELFFYFVELCLTDYANVFDVEHDVFCVQRRAIISFYAFAS